MIITVASAKGGTGKTSTSAAILQCAIKEGLKVLAVDMDPQASLSYWFKADLTKYTSFDLLQGASIADTIQTTESGADIISGSASLSTLRTAPASGRRLEKALQSIKKDYDLIVIDSPPSIGESFYNSIYAGDILIPVEADAVGLQALYQLHDVLTLSQANKPTLSVLGVVISRYDSRSRISRYMRSTIEEKCEELSLPYLGEIRRSIAVSESMAMRQSLFDSGSKNHAVEDYKRLYDLITKKDI